MIGCFIAGLGYATPEEVFPKSKKTQVLISVDPGLPSGQAEKSREEDAARKRADQWWFQFDCARKGCEWVIVHVKSTSLSWKGKGRGRTSRWDAPPETNWDRQGRCRSYPSKKNPAGYWLSMREPMITGKLHYEPAATAGT